MDKEKQREMARELVSRVALASDHFAYCLLLLFDKS